MDCDKLLTLGTEMGRLLMTSGAEIYRVEESMSRLLVAYGMDPQVFAIPNCIIVSITTPQGQPITRMVRIPAHGTDIELLERCNQLCRQLCAHPLPVDKALKLVSGLTQSRTYSTGGLLLSYPVAAAFFGMFFGGDLMDGVGAFLCGLAIGLFLLFGQRITGSNAFLRTAICAAVAAVLPAPGENSGGVYRAAYRLIQWVALNLGKARNAQDMQKTIPDDGKR